LKLSLSGWKGVSCSFLWSLEAFYLADIRLKVIAKSSTLKVRKIIGRGKAGFEGFVDREGKRSYRFCP